MSEKIQKDLELISRKTPYIWVWDRTTKQYNMRAISYRCCGNTKVFTTHTWGCNYEVGLGDDDIYYPAEQPVLPNPFKNNENYWVKSTQNLNGNWIIGRYNSMGDKFGLQNGILVNRNSITDYKHIERP